MHDLENLYRQLEQQLRRPLTPEERRLLALGELRPQVIPISRRAESHKPTGS